MLIGEPGVLFTKDEIFDRLWPDVTVTDNALTQVISELRFAMGDKPGSAVYIETVPRRGYRWIAPVEVVDPDPVVRPTDAGAGLEVSSPLTQAAQLQSAIVTALMAGLKVTLTASPSQSVAPKETPSLEAERLVNEGRLKLETLQPKAIQSAVTDFTRAIALDPVYTRAHIGLAHARFWRYQATRAQNRPDFAELDAAIAHAERAVELDPSQAEAHAALAFFLSVTSRVEDRLKHGRLAVSLEPGNWRYQFQLGAAAWGSERLECLASVIKQYPALTHAHFAASMVHIARGDLGAADALLAEGLDTQRKTSSDRLPGRGLNWVRGMIAFRQGRVADARAAFDAELAVEGDDMFADEFLMDAMSAHGFVCLAEKAAASAEAWFMRALKLLPDHARSWFGLSTARRLQGNEKGADDARHRAEQAVRELNAHGRDVEGAMAMAAGFFLDHDIKDACQILADMLTKAPAGLGCWTLPVEPWLREYMDDKRVLALFDQLASRAT